MFYIEYPFYKEFPTYREAEIYCVLHGIPCEEIFEGEEI